MGDKVTVVKIEYNFLDVCTTDETRKIIESADVTFEMGNLEGKFRIATNRYLELRDIIYELMRYLKINTNGEECHESWR